MNNLESNNKMADFLRLANLKNLVSGRLGNRQDRQFAEMQNPDFDGISMPPPPAPIVPTTPGNFDVRANQKIEPETFTPPQNVYKGLVNLSAIPRTSSNELQDPLEAIRARVQEEPELMDLLPPETREMLSVVRPNPEKPFLPPSGTNMPEMPAPSNLTQKKYEPLPGMNSPPPNPFSSIAKLPNGNMPAPKIGETQLGQPVAPQPEQPNLNLGQTTQPAELGSQTQPGAITQAMQQPSLKAKIDEIFGPVDPAMAQSAESYAKAMQAYSQSLDDVTARLDEREKQIKERIESRNLTTQDKILMALALVAPMVVAGFAGGKEALIGALGGGAKGLADVFTGRVQEGKEDTEELSGLALDKAKIAKEKAGIEPLTAEFKSKIAESIPNKDLREIFTRDGELIGDKLVINSGNPNLPIKADAIRDITDYKRIKKEIPDFANLVSSTDQSMQIIDSMHKLLDAANESKNWTGRNFVNGATMGLYDNAAGAIKAYVPWARDTVKDENGKEHKISALYNTLRTQLSEIWRKSNTGTNTGNAFRATEEHFFNQLPDLFSKEAFTEGLSDVNQNKKQLDLVKDKFTRNILTYLDQQGIDTERISGKLKTSTRNKELSEQERKRNRAEQAVQQTLGGK